MKCDDIRRHFGEYIDGECGGDISSALEQHLNECEDCRREFAAYQAFHAALAANLDEEELPFDFLPNLAERLAEEKRRQTSRQPVYRRTWVKVAAGCACLLLVLGAFGIGLNALNAPKYNYSADTASRAEAPMAAEESVNYYTSSQDANGGYNKGYGGASAGSVADGDMMAADDSLDTGMTTGEGGAAANTEAAEAAMGRKIIKNWNLTLKVDDFGAAYNAIQQIATKYDGYVVDGYTNNYEDSSYRDGNISIRVAAEDADMAVDEIGALGKVESDNFSTDDVTAEYYDIQSRLAQYRAQEERLLELYAQAETIADLISVESELTRIQTEIDSLEGTVRYYDQLTALSLIRVYLYTPSAYTQAVEPKGWDEFITRLGEGFLEGLNNILDFFANLVVFIVGVLPALVIIAIIIVVVVLLVRKAKRKKLSK